MRRITSDIIQYIKSNAATSPFMLVVVPVNVALRRNGHGIMGAGFARAIRDYYLARGINPEEELGRKIKEAQVASGEQYPAAQIWASSVAPLVYVPTKLHWKERSPESLVKDNLKRLVKETAGAAGPFVVPLMGGGHGGIPYNRALRMMEDILTDDRFIYISPPRTY